MATISKIWAAVQDLYKTNLYGGVDADINGTERFSSDIDLETDGYEAAHVHLRYDNAGNTDNLKISIYASLDGVNYDDLPLNQFIADKNGGADTEISFIVRDVAHFRIGMVRDGATDTYDVHLTCQRWRWQSV